MELQQQQCLFGKQGKSNYLPIAYIVTVYLNHCLYIQSVHCYSTVHRTVASETMHACYMCLCEYVCVCVYVLVSMCV